MSKLELVRDTELTPPPEVPQIAYSLDEVLSGYKNPRQPKKAPRKKEKEAPKEEVKEVVESVASSVNLASVSQPEPEAEPAREEPKLYAKIGSRDVLNEKLAELNDSKQSGLRTYQKDLIERELNILNKREGMDPESLTVKPTKSSGIIGSMKSVASKVGGYFKSWFS